MSDLDRGWFAALPPEAWPEIVELLTATGKPWPEWAPPADLRWHHDTKTPIPGRGALMARWRWSDWRVRGVMASDWRDPRHSDRPVLRDARAAGASRRAPSPPASTETHRNPPKPTDVATGKSAVTDENLQLPPKPTETHRAASTRAGILHTNTNTDTSTRERARATPTTQEEPCTHDQETEPQGVMPAGSPPPPPSSTAGPGASGSRRATGDGGSGSTSRPFDEPTGGAPAASAASTTGVAVPLSEADAVLSWAGARSLDLDPSRPPFVGNALTILSKANRDAIRGAVARGMSLDEAKAIGAWLASDPWFAEKGHLNGWSLSNVLGRDGSGWRDALGRAAAARAPPKPKMNGRKRPLADVMREIEERMDEGGRSWQAGK